MRVFVTGGTGFIGGHVASELRERGDEVICLVRNREKARSLVELGCELVEGDLADAAAIRQGMEGCDGAIHGAAIYEVGVPKSRHPAMYEANVVGTERVLRTALELGIPKAVYVSTVAAFGNTAGRVVDESFWHFGPPPNETPAERGRRWVETAVGVGSVFALFCLLFYLVEAS